MGEVQGLVLSEGAPICRVVREVQMGRLQRLPPMQSPPAPKQQGGCSLFGYVSGLSERATDLLGKLATSAALYSACLVTRALHQSMPDLPHCDVNAHSLRDS